MNDASSAPPSSAPPPSSPPRASALPPEHFAAPCGPRPGEVGVVSAGEARAYAPGPRWYRLPDESWAMIRAEYLAGATAKQLAVKWGVSATSIYRHACQDGFTKARRGEAINLEAVTRFAAQAAAAEARAALAARAQVEAQGEEARRAREEEAEADPGEAARVLLRRAAALALRGRTGEAQAGAKLAETLMRTLALVSPPAPAPRFEPDWEPEWEDEQPPDAIDLERIERLRAHVETRIGELLAEDAAAASTAAGDRAGNRDGDGADTGDEVAGRRLD